MASTSQMQPVPYGQAISNWICCKCDSRTSLEGGRELPETPYRLSWHTHCDRQFMRKYPDGSGGYYAQGGPCSHERCDGCTSIPVGREDDGWETVAFNATQPYQENEGYETDPEFVHVDSGSLASSSSASEFSAFGHQQAADSQYGQYQQVASVHYPDNPNAYYASSVEYNTDSMASSEYQSSESMYQSAESMHQSAGSNQSNTRNGRKSGKTNQRGGAQAKQQPRRIEIPGRSRRVGAK
ncbi:hypothetical protein QBC47DRAFT_356809 [Echria macrotheca]|uniref:Uncharacterized protein n=1 Tax=Echria macrotheca TaxID=438768 RepID=A0AAJ0BIL2_9PEZI|nr:hypothetical protein QBC47DRAFT_356809 [Echria macrotheca]